MVDVSFCLVRKYEIILDSATQQASVSLLAIFPRGMPPSPWLGKYLRPGGGYVTKEPSAQAG